MTIIVVASYYGPMAVHFDSAALCAVSYYHDLVYYIVYQHGI